MTSFDDIDSRHTALISGVGETAGEALVEVRAALISAIPKPRA